MIRPFTCICMLLAAGSGLYLYQTKHRAQLLDQQIARTYKQIDVTRDRIASLKAEWALLNEPDRLKDLAQQHTTLKTLAPTQFVALADLPSHLPAPLPPGPPAIPADDQAPAAPLVPVATAKPALHILASNDKAPADRPAPDKQVADKPAPQAPRATPRPPTPPVAVASALPTPSQPLPRPMPFVPPITPPATAPAATPAAPRILARVLNVSAGAIQPPGSIGDSVARAARLAAAAPQVLSASAATYAPPPYAPPAAATAPAQAPSLVGSALGSAAHTALPPPVPFGAAQSR